MKAPKVKAVLVDTYEDARFEERRWVGEAWQLPADAESYERMVEQVSRALCRSDNFRPNWATSYNDAARAALRAIGITPPRTGKGRK